MTQSQARRALLDHFPLPRRGPFARRYCHCGARVPCAKREQALNVLAQLTTNTTR